MATSILLINPLGTDMLDQLTVDIVEPHLSPDTEVVCRSLGGTVPPSPYRSSPEQHYNQLIAMVRGAAAEGFDAVGISCCGDPALKECKQVSSIPVTGALEAMCVGARLFAPVCIMQRYLPDPSWRTVPTQKGVDWMKRNVASYGLSGDLVTFRRVPIDEHPDKETMDRLSVEDPDLAREQLLGAMEKAALGPGLEQSLAAQADGMASVYFACTFWGGLLDRLKEELDVNVLDPLVVVAKYTEFLAVVA